MASAVVALLLLPLIYLVFFQAPFKEKLLQADTAYLKVDYTGVIDELEGVAPSSLPTTQKYELATSYLQGLNFSEDQKRSSLTMLRSSQTASISTTGSISAVMTLPKRWIQPSGSTIQT